MAPRNRLLYAGLAALTIACGLATRPPLHTTGGLPAKYLGDALYAVLIYLLLAWIWRRGTRLRIALIALTFCFAVEFGQLWQADWLDSIRQTLPGRLILGRGFGWFDLVAYLTGIAVCFLLERHFQQNSSSKNP